MSNLSLILFHSVLSRAIKHGFAGPMPTQAVA
jgi:hypothetical protein